MEDDQKASSQEINTDSIRQNLVDTAVNFLQNIDVVNKPEKTKAAFLRNKGLNDAEIALAFDKAKQNSRFNAISNQNHIAPLPLPYPQKTYSFWAQLGRISSSLIVVAVALYGLHRFYQLYIDPWLFGTKSEESQLSLMEQHLIQLNNSVAQLSTTVSTLEKSVNSHKQQIDSMIEASGIVSASVAVSSLKTEIGNVKSLLINRHQFPAVPKVVSPSIPHWQLQSAENDDSESEPISETVADLEQNLSTKTECNQLSGSPSSDLLLINASENNGTENGISESPVDELSNQKSLPHDSDTEKD